MHQQEVMQHIMQHVANNSIPEELRENADGSLSLHMLAAKLKDPGHGATHSTKWEMSANGTVTVTLNQRDAKRYGRTKCSVTRDQFEHIVLSTIGRKIKIAPLEHADWDKFRQRLKQNRTTASAGSSVPAKPTRSQVGSSMTLF